MQIERGRIAPSKETENENPIRCRASRFRAFVGRARETMILPEGDDFRRQSRGMNSTKEHVSLSLGVLTWYRLNKAPSRGARHIYVNDAATGISALRIENLMRASLESTSCTCAKQISFSSGRQHYLCKQWRNNIPGNPTGSIELRKREKITKMILLTTKIAFRPRLVCRHISKDMYIVALFFD